MNRRFIQIFGLIATALYAVFVVWIYAAAPKGIMEVPEKAKESVENVTSKAKVVTNTYEVDKAKFDEGRALFIQERYPAARDVLRQADPEKKDAETQYLIAYSFYRQGWGRFSSDDELYQKGLEQVRFVRKLDSEFLSKDGALVLRRPVELEEEIKEGLKVTASDFNPLKAFQERK